MAKNEYVVKSAVQTTVENKTDTVEIEEKIEEEVVKLEKNKEKFKIDKEELLADIP
jgi:low affinity Fe/Cu permease